MFVKTFEQQSNNILSHGQYQDYKIAVFSHC